MMKRSFKRIVRGLAIAAAIPNDRMPVVRVCDKLTATTDSNPKSDS